MNVPIACNPDSGGGRMCRLLPPRVGLTLIEILMTIFVLAIGLLGVAALLPVGTFQMRQGQIAQQSAEVGSRALDTIEASGINHPGRWARLGTFPNGTSFDAVDITDLNNPVRIACPVASDSSSGTSLTTTANTANKLNLVDTDLADCLVEFVRGQSGLLTQQEKIATSSLPDITLDTPGFTPDPVANDVFVIKRYAPFAIDPLYVAAQQAAPVFAPNIERLTLFDGAGASSTIGPAAAEAVFESTDELQFTPGREGDSASSSEDESKLPEQVLLNPSSGYGKRQSQGEYSWLATFVPVEPAGISKFRDGRTYTVSVAVFYKRPLQLPSTVSERTLTLAHDGGSTFTISGTTFEDNDGDGIFDQEAGDESHIKSGLWGLVTYTDGTDPRARWYRLGSVGKPADTTDNPVKARLIGPDFPTGATSPQITFYEGVVAVFERTMQVPELPLGKAQ